MDVKTRTYIGWLCALLFAPCCGLAQRWEPSVDLYALNHFAFDPDFDTRKTGVRWAGAGLGFQRELTQNWDLTLRAGINLARPRPAFRPDNGEFSAFGSGHLAVLAARKTDHWMWSAGVLLSQHVWVYDRTGVPDSIPATRPLLQTRTWAVGVQLEGLYRVHDAFHVGAVWRPTYFRFSDRNPGAGEHVLSLTVRYYWKRMPDPTHSS